MTSAAFEKNPAASTETPRSAGQLADGDDEPEADHVAGEDGLREELGDESEARDPRDEEH